MAWGGYSTKAIIREFSAAHEIAEGNTKPPVSHDTELCNERMFRVGMVDNAILEIGDREDAPDELKNFIEACNDSACPSCWVSSRSDKIHPECQKKISRYFETRKKLLELGNKLRNGGVAKKTTFRLLSLIGM